MKHAVPLFATVSRSTGEIRIQWGDDEAAQRRFGEIMNRIGAAADAFLDRTCAETFGGAAVNKTKSERM